MQSRQPPPEAKAKDDRFDSELAEIRRSLDRLASNAQFRSSGLWQDAVPLGGKGTSHAGHTASAAPVATSLEDINGIAESLYTPPPPPPPPPHRTSPPSTTPAAISFDNGHSHLQTSRVAPSSTLSFTATRPSPAVLTSAGLEQSLGLSSANTTTSNGSVSWPHDRDEHRSSKPSAPGRGAVPPPAVEPVDDPFGIDFAAAYRDSVARIMSAVSTA